MQRPEKSRRRRRLTYAGQIQEKSGKELLRGVSNSGIMAEDDMSLESLSEECEHERHVEDLVPNIISEENSGEIMSKESYSSVISLKEEIIMKGIFNARTHHSLSIFQGYTAEELSCVWPPMLLVCFETLTLTSEAEAKPPSILEPVREFLVKKGLQENSLQHISNVCSEGTTSWDIFVLPASAEAFATARAIDSTYFWGSENLRNACCYPSLKDVREIKNGRVPESARQFLIQSLPYCGRSRDNWVGCSVDLVWGDGSLVGSGICERSHFTEKTGDVVVIVRVKDVLRKDLVPADWKDAFRPWKATEVLYQGVSLLECLRQFQANNKDSSSSVQRSSQSNCSHNSWKPKLPNDLLAAQPIRSVAPLICSIEQYLARSSEGVEENKKDAADVCEWSKTVQALIKDTQECESNSTEEKEPESKNFLEKLMALEEQNFREVQDTLTEINTKENLMQELWTISGTSAARGIGTRLTILKDLVRPNIGSILLRQMLTAGVDMQLGTLSFIKEETHLQMIRKKGLQKMQIEAERSFLELRNQQHKDLLEQLEKYGRMRVCQLESYASEKMKLLDGILSAKREIESVQHWLTQHTNIATEKVKKIYKEEKLKMEEQNFLKVDNEKKKLRKRICDAEMKSRTLEEKVKKAEMEKRKMENDLKDARDQLAEANAVMQEGICVICFHMLEGCFKKKRIRITEDDLPIRKRGCFYPCMHATMCLECSIEAWERYRRCPLCNTESLDRPEAIFL